MINHDSASKNVIKKMHNAEEDLYEDYMRVSILKTPEIVFSILKSIFLIRK